MHFLDKNFSRISLYLTVYVAISGTLSIALLVNGNNNTLVLVLLVSIVLSTLIHAVWNWDRHRIQGLELEENAHQKREQHFHKIMESVNQGIVRTDSTHIITTINPHMVTLLGLPSDQIIGQSLISLFSTLQANYDPNQNQQELKYTHPDGTNKWMEINISPVHFDNNEQNEYVCMCIDITDHKIKLNALQERERHLRTIITNLPVILFAINPKGIITLSEGKGLDLLGLKHGELVGQSVWELYKDNVQSTANFKRALAGQTFTTQTTINDVVLETIYTPLLDAQDEVLATIGVSIDVTKRVRADKERERLASIIDHSEDFIAISDLQHQHIQYVNLGGVQMSGYENAEAMIGQPLTKFYKYDKEQIHKTLRSITKRSWREETELIKKDNSLLPVEQTQFIIRDERGVPYAMATLMSDITERLRSKLALEQARDRALEASALKSEFLATMSHEIRTPMNGIIGMTELLIETDLDEEQHEFSTIVLGEAFHLLNLINDILDFAKIEAGEVILEHRIFSPHEIVQNVHALLNPNANKKNLDFIVQIAPQVPNSMVGDPTRLRQILINLVGNAIKFTEEGHVRIRMQVASQNDEHISLRFEIEDTGIGIAIEDNQRMFQPFTQVDGSHTRKYGGTGLGLVVAKRLVELMDGRIDYKSIQGSGSTFWFTAQFDQATQSSNDSVDNITKSPVTALPEMDLTGIRTLVVNNQERQTTALRTQLSQLNIESHACLSVDDALSQLNSAFNKGAPYDIALISDSLPDTDRERFLTEFEQSHSVTLTHLIYVGEIASNATVRTQLTQGFVTCLKSPVQPASIRKALNAAATIIISDEHIAERVSLKETNRGTVLLVEDNVANRDVVLRQLLHMGYIGHAVTNGQEALRLLFSQTNPYDMIFMDLQMPVMDGLETTRRIRQWEVQTNEHIPIIALTANAHQKDHETGIAAGMDDYITKPMTMSTLRTVLEQWIPQNKA